MQRESGSRKFPIWLIGDSNPKTWENALEYPLDPRHPARHNIWTPILDGIQEQVFLADRRRVRTDRLYVRNAVQDPEEKDGNIEKETSDFGDLLTRHNPKIVFTFGSFAFEFARQSVGENPKNYRHWNTKKLGDQFRQRTRDFDPEKTNIFPLLHVSIARRWFLKSHDYFTGAEGGNYFDYVAEEISSLLLQHKDKLSIWIP
ncbi:MAG: hypothetical protein J4F42_07175 [Desulfurellaceae bacterium]|nr:hypothetical protein [Desulfurellaceae bacterium]